MPLAHPPAPLALPPLKGGSYALRVGLCAVSVLRGINAAKYRFAPLLSLTRRAFGAQGSPQALKLSVGGAAPTLFVFVDYLGGGRCPHPSTAPQAPENEKKCKRSVAGQRPRYASQTSSVGAAPPTRAINVLCAIFALIARYACHARNSSLLAYPGMIGAGIGIVCGERFGESVRPRTIGTSAKEHILMLLIVQNCVYRVHRCHIYRTWWQPRI